MQIEKILNEKDNVKKDLQLKNYLSLKYCIWLSFIEWILDLAVLPFILGYALIPWRFRELFKLAVDQYEGVPTQKIRRSHYVRDINAGKKPKSVQLVI